MNNVKTRGAAPSSTLLSVLRQDWFGVWDTDIVPQPVFSTTVLGVFTVYIRQ